MNAWLAQCNRIGVQSDGRALSRHHAAGADRHSARVRPIGLVVASLLPAVGLIACPLCVPPGRA